MKFVSALAKLAGPNFTKPRTKTLADLCRFAVVIFAMDDVFPAAIDVVGSVERLVLGAAGGGGAEVAHAAGGPDRPPRLTLQSNRFMENSSTLLHYRNHACFSLTS